MPRRDTRIEPLTPDPAETGRRSAVLVSDEVEDREAEVIDPAHREAIAEGLAQLDRGDHASDASIRAIYRRAGL